MSNFPLVGKENGNKDWDINLSECQTRNWLETYFSSVFIPGLMSSVTLFCLGYVNK